LAPPELPGFIATTDPSVTLSALCHFPVLPVIGSVTSEHFCSGRGGLLQLLCMSLLPCRRYRPAGVSSRTNQSSIAHAAFAQTLKARPPEILPFEVTLRSLALRPGNSLAIPRTALSMGFNRFGFPCGCHPSYGNLVPFPAGLAPAEHACLTWTHVGSRAGAVILRFRLRLFPPFRAWRALMSFNRDSVSSPRHVKRSMRVSRTTLS
jgi:hypothetical protein